MPDSMLIAGSLPSSAVDGPGKLVWPPSGFIFLTCGSAQAPDDCCRPTDILRPGEGRGPGAALARSKMALMEYNGSAIVAMAGKGCVGMASDKRLGSNRLQTVSTDFQKVFQVTDSTLVGLAGLATDVQTLRSHLRFRMNLYKLREEREMGAPVVANLLGSMLYGRRFAPWFVSPVVAGLDEKNQPVLATYDFIGARVDASDFVASGTSSEQLMGLCESFWKPDMESEELFETLSQCLLAAVDRDCLAGWGATVTILTPDQIVTRHLKSRMD